MVFLRTVTGTQCPFASLHLGAATSNRAAGLVLAALLASIASAVAQFYSVKDLGVLTALSGPNESGPKGINNTGAVAGVNAIQGSYRALLYTGTWTNLGTLGGGRSLAAGLNSSGQIIGYSEDSTGATRGFLWTAGATDGIPGNPQMKQIGSLGPGVTAAYGINDQGHLTGYSDTEVKSNIEQHAFVWRNGTMTDIGALLDKLPNSFGYWINNLGHVAGTAYNASYSSAHAFYYDGVSARDIGGLGGDASALAINDSDQITGYATVGGGDHAFRYAAGVMKDLGTLGGHYSYGLDINNGGVIVGGSFIDAGDSIYHAFLWSNNIMQDLNVLVDASGAGWVLVEARALNERGQIVGSGTFQGETHAFLLSPAPPAAPIITGVSLEGSAVVLQVTSVSNAVYSVEARSDPACGNWSTVLTGVPGTGCILDLCVPFAAERSFIFFRVGAANDR